MSFRRKMIYKPKKSLIQVYVFSVVVVCAVLSGFNVKPSEAMTVELRARKAGCSLAAGWGELVREDC